MNSGMRFGEPISAQHLQTAWLAPAVGKGPRGTGRCRGVAGDGVRKKPDELRQAHGGVDAFLVVVAMEREDLVQSAAQDRR